MEAFPHIWLVSNDTVLITALPHQLAHAVGQVPQIYAGWESAEAELHSMPPEVLLLDCQTTLPDLTALRTAHPLMACIGIGAGQPETEAQRFASHPLMAFVKRPVSVPALVRSIEHLHYQRKMTAGQQSLPLGKELAFDPALHRITKTGSAHIELTDKETAILMSLYHHRHDWLPRHVLLEEVWGYNDEIATHTLETHLYRLRTKLRDGLGQEDLIQTHQGAYQLKLA